MVVANSEARDERRKQKQRERAKRYRAKKKANGVPLRNAAQKAAQAERQRKRYHEYKNSPDPYKRNYDKLRQRKYRQKKKEEATRHCKNRKQSDENPKNGMGSTKCGEKGDIALEQRYDETQCGRLIHENKDLMPTQDVAPIVKEEDEQIPGGPSAGEGDTATSNVQGDEEDVSTDGVVIKKEEDGVVFVKNEEGDLVPKSEFIE